MLRPAMEITLLHGVDFLLFPVLPLWISKVVQKQLELTQKPELIRVSALSPRPPTLHAMVSATGSPALVSRGLPRRVLFSCSRLSNYSFPLQYQRHLSGLYLKETSGNAVTSLLASIFGAISIFHNY